MHLTEQAHELGVDGFLVVTPYYNKPPPSGIVAHFKAIAAASDSRSSSTTSRSACREHRAETMVELAQIPSVQAVKQATEDLDQARRITEETDLAALRGQTTPRLSVSGEGGIGGVRRPTGHRPGRVKEMIRLHNEG